MNGINYSTLFTSTGLFGQSKASKDGRATGTTAKKAQKQNVLEDTVELDSSKNQLKKAVYERPVQKAVSRQESVGKEEQTYQLSENAQKLLEELKKKYGNMEFRVARWSTDEEEAYYASKCTKDFSVLIDPEALEAMAADETVRAQYESILENASDTSATLKEELGEAADRIRNFTVSIDQDGKVSYTLQLIEDFSKRNSENAKKQQEALEQTREEKAEDKKKTEKTKIQADSLEELIAKVKEKLQIPEQE